MCFVFDLFCFVSVWVNIDTNVINTQPHTTTHRENTNINIIITKHVKTTSQITNTYQKQNNTHTHHNKAKQ